jgi:hypothetical protein
VMTLAALIPTNGEKGLPRREKKRIMPFTLQLHLFGDKGR